MKFSTRYRNTFKMNSNNSFLVIAAENIKNWKKENSIKHAELSSKSMPNREKTLLTIESSIPFKTSRLIWRRQAVFSLMSGNHFSHNFTLNARSLHYYITVHFVVYFVIILIHFIQQTLVALVTFRNFRIANWVPRSLFLNRINT